jgi:serine/threonine-protein kinase
MIHRDVKPDNILFDERNQPCLCDFGILKVVGGGSENAAFATQYTQGGFAIGTPRYMAPEIIMGNPVDGRVDQFALGVTLYELLAGCPPFPTNTRRRY